MIRDDSNACYDCFWQVLVAKNMVIWKERIHDNEVSFVEWNASYITAVRDCGILKLFWTLSMVSHEQLLEHILCMWNPEQQYFEVGGHIITVEVEDIYFLIGLSRRGAPISLTGSHARDITTRELIDHHCAPGTRTQGKKIPIRVLKNGPLWTILFTMQRVTECQGVH